MLLFFSIKTIFAVQRWRICAIALLLATCVPSAFAEDEKGCQGVGYAKQPFAQYSPEKLHARLERDPKDVDALINVGIRLEEQNQISHADALYERAIQAKPDCYLGYLFAGLVRDRISQKAAADAEANIRKALSLNPSLHDDGNVRGFMKRHPQPQGAVGTQKETPSEIKEILTIANRFSVGLGVGMLVATLIFYVVGSRQARPRGT
jgi:tetratricopeptide (TPR) repeat protein